MPAPGGATNFGHEQERIYDARLGRWLSVDPLFRQRPGWSPYRAFYCNPIIYTDAEGKLEVLKIIVTDQRTGLQYIFKAITNKFTLRTDGEVHHNVGIGESDSYSQNYYNYETTLNYTIDKNGSIKPSGSPSTKLLTDKVMEEEYVWGKPAGKGETLTDWDAATDINRLVGKSQTGGDNSDSELDFSGIRLVGVNDISANQTETNKHNPGHEVDEIKSSILAALGAVDGSGGSVAETIKTIGSAIDKANDAINEAKEMSTPEEDNSYIEPETPIDTPGNYSLKRTSDSTAELNTGNTTATVPIKKSK